MGFAANLLAIPLVTLVITPLALLGTLLPPLWTAAAWAVQALQAVLAVMAAWPGAVWTAAAAPPWGIACGLLGGALLVLPLPRRLRLSGLPLLLPLLWPPIERPADGRFEAVVADIGQGTAVLLRTLVRTCSSTTPARSIRPRPMPARACCCRCLRARGENAVDLLVLSHRDTDHIGGAATLLAGVPVRASLSSLAPDHPLFGRLPAHRRCDAGQRWAWDGVQFDVLHPAPEDHALPLRPNALSCVLKVTGADGRRLLLTGDIEAAQEVALVERLGAAGLASDALLVPHHGSKTSSTAAFLDAVAPRTAFVQAAYRSRFGHPAPEVLVRYAERGIDVRRSDACGATTLPADGGPGVCERERQRRYWHHRGIVPPGAAP